MLHICKGICKKLEIDIKYKMKEGLIMDYNELRTVVANCVEGKRNDRKFRLNTFKLKKKVEEFGLIPVIYKNNYESKRATPEDIPLLSEYFKEENVLWFDDQKTFLTIIFVREEDLDERLQDLLEDCYEQKKRELQPPKLPCNVKPIRQQTGCRKCNICDDRSIDIVNTLAQITGLYPCYTALIAKWVKPDSISLNIRFRANSLLINSEE